MILTPYLLEQFMFSRALCAKKCSITPDPAWGPQLRGGPGEVTRWVFPCVSNIQTNYSWSFRIFRVLARFSKYEFWNREENLNLYRWKYFFENIFFQDQKNCLWKFENIFRFFSDKKMKILKNRNFGNFEIFEDFQNFEILKFSKFWFFKILVFCQKTICKYVFFFSKNFFWSWKKYIFEKYFYLHQLKISPGFQKSYSENRTMNLNMRKLQLYFVCIFETRG